MNRDSVSKFAGHWLAFFLVFWVLLGSGLRFHQLGDKSLWSDELFTMGLVQYHPLVPEAEVPFFRIASVLTTKQGDSFLTAKASEQSPPLNDLMEKATVSLLGATEFAARLPAAATSCLLLLGVALLAWQRRAEPVGRVFVWALLLFALSPALIMYAKDARAYAAGVSFIGLGSLFWLSRWWHGSGQWKAPGWAEIIWFILACYCHYNAAALVAILLTFDAVMATRKRDTTAWLRLSVVGLAFGLWVLLALETIVSTAHGAVSWGHKSPWEKTVSTVVDTGEIFFLPWVCLACVVGAWVAWRAKGKSTDEQSSGGIWRVAPLLGIIAAYLLVAGFVVGRSGMAHPRYYIFVLPVLILAMAMVFAELKKPWQIGVVAAVLMGLALSANKTPVWMVNEDYRGMSAFAVKDTDDKTLFLYPWEPNRFLYRFYLERFGGQGINARMIGISGTVQAPAVCEKLLTASHVVLIAHESGRSFFVEPIKLCGHQFVRESEQKFPYTFVQHWRK